MRKSTIFLRLMPGMIWIMTMTIILATGAANGQVCGVKPGGVVREYHMGDDGSVQGWTEREYDDQGRRTRETRKDGNGKVIRSRKIAYDQGGQVTKSIDKDSKGNIVYLQERLYNDSGRLIKDYTEESGRVTLWTEYAYDEKGNMTWEINRDLSGSIVKRFDYDTGWNLKNDVKDADPFKAFYINFKSSKKFQRDHTRFPLEVIIYQDGENAETAQKKKISRKEWKFTDFSPKEWDIAIMKTDKDSPDESALRLKGKDNHVLVYYKFKKIDAKWYLVQIEDLSS